MMGDNGHDDQTRRERNVPDSNSAATIGVLIFFGCFLVGMALPVLATLLQAGTINHTQGAIIGCVGITVWVLVATQ